MSELLLTLINRSLAACWLILAIVLLRPFLRKISPSITCALWGLVAIRLLCPFSFESVLSLIPSAEPIPVDAVLPQTQLPPQIPVGEGGGTVVDSVVSAPPPSTSIPAGSAGGATAPSLIQIAAVVWIVGIAALAVYLFVSYLRLYLLARESVKQEDGFWLCEGITSPFVLGVFRPRILLPYTVEKGDIPYILAHERAHLARRDHWRKPIGFAVLAVFWFQPFLWLAYFLLCRDIEFACDERALRTLGSDVQHKKCYAEALLRGVSPRASVIACPVAFGGLQIKGRVKSVLRYRKPAMLLTFAVLIVCAAVAICFLTDPITRATEESGKKNPAPEGSASLSNGKAEEFYPFYGTVSEQTPEGYVYIVPSVDDEAALASLCSKALNADTLSMAEPMHLPTFRFDSQEEWDTFLRAYRYLFDFDVAVETEFFPNKPEDPFFQKYALILTYAPNGMASRGWGEVYQCDGKQVQVFCGTGKQKADTLSRLYFCYVPRDKLSLYPAGFDAVVYPAGKPVILPNDLPYDPIQRLEELEEMDHRGSTLGFLYLEGVLSGEIDPTAPKLDLETAKNIISSREQDSDAFEKIMEEFISIQLYPDISWGSGLSWIEYWFDDYGKDLLRVGWPVIYHITVLPDGTETSELLFETRPDPSIGWSGTREALVLSMLGEMEPGAASAGLMEIYGEVGAYTLCKLVNGEDTAIVENVYDGYRIFSPSIGYPSETHLYLVGDTEIYTLNAAYEQDLIENMGTLYALLPEGMQAGYDPSAEDSYGGWESGANRYGFRDGIYRVA